MELLALKCTFISLPAFRISVLCETKLTTWDVQWCLLFVERGGLEVCPKILPCG